MQIKRNVIYIKAMHKKNKKTLIVPKFRNEDEERAFWDKIDFSDYIEAKDLQSVVFPNLRPTTKPISIRLPQFLIARLKERAHELDVPYQALIKEYIANGMASKNR